MDLWVWFFIALIPAFLGLFSRRLWIALLLIALDVLAFALLMARFFDASFYLIVSLYLMAPVLVLFGRWRARREHEQRAYRT